MVNFFRFLAAFFLLFCMSYLLSNFYFTSIYKILIRSKSNLNIWTFARYYTVNAVIHYIISFSSFKSRNWPKWRHWTTVETTTTQCRHRRSDITNISITTSATNKPRRLWWQWARIDGWNTFRFLFFATDTHGQSVIVHPIESNTRSKPKLVPSVGQTYDTILCDDKMWRDRETLDCSRCRAELRI